MVQQKRQGHSQVQLQTDVSVMKILSRDHNKGRDQNWMSCDQPSALARRELKGDCGGRKPEQSPPSVMQLQLHNVSQTSPPLHLPLL